VTVAAAPSISLRTIPWQRALVGLACVAAGVTLLAPWVHSEGLSARAADSRIRTARYETDQVYPLQGFVGYAIDLEFEPGESFVGLGAGDLGGLTFAAQANHLFLKPKAPGVVTNLTVLTDRRAYHFDYTVSARHPLPGAEDLVYVLRFTYPPPPGAAGDVIGRRLAEVDTRQRNLDYWYAGSASLRPTAAWDDGVQTHLRFGSRQELPAVFLRNDDGSESLVNTTIDDGDVIVHRVSARLIVRRGKLSGCIVNESFSGGGKRLRSGTVTPAVERVTRSFEP
jgi:type IV secretion system protein VirB9